MPPTGTEFTFAALAPPPLTYWRANCDCATSLLACSPAGLTAVTTADGRFTALMPHPERVFRNVQMSWTNGDRSSASPWMRMFGNARRCVA